MDNSSSKICFETPVQLAQWLKKNHATESELWITLYKKHSGIKSISWDEVVIESLCWGWIDGIKQSIDEQSYRQRITPRKAQSNWSKRNTEHVERLIKEGRMTDHGLLHVHAAKSDGRWDKAYVASQLEVPADFISAVESQPKVNAFFQSLSKSSRYVIAHGLTSAKKKDTRQKRFTLYMNMLIAAQRPK